MIVERYETLILLVALWSGWCFLHSFLIADSVTAWMKRRLKERFAYYRLFYVCLSVMTFFPIAFFQLTSEQQVIFSWSGWWQVLRYAGVLYALFMFWAGARAFDLGYFLGFQQIEAYKSKTDLPAGQFSSTGILQYVRHPWYSGGIVLVWVFGPVTDLSLAVKIVLTAYLIVGTKLEERKMVRVFGEEYRDFQRQVPMLVPWKRRAG